MIFQQTDPVGIRVEGIDLAEHAETGYDLVGAATSALHFGGTAPAASAPAQQEGARA